MSTPKGAETVELRRVTVNRYDEEEPTGTLITFKRCAVIPRQLGEDSDRGSVAIPGHTVYIPPQITEWDASVSAGDRWIKDTDQLLVRGAWTSIEGRPAVYLDLRGRAKGTMVTTEGEK